MYSYFTNKSHDMTVCYRKKKCIQDILRIGVASSLLVLKWVAIFERLGTTALDVRTYSYCRLRDIPSLGIMGEFGGLQEE